jgi:hypothetical protein
MIAGMIMHVQEGNLEWSGTSYRTEARRKCASSTCIVVTLSGLWALLTSQCFRGAGSLPHHGIEETLLEWGPPLHTLVEATEI